MSETKIIIDVTGFAMIFATIAGPVIAVWASEWRQHRKSSKDNRERLFRTLMMTRATRLNIAHVESLNQIDFVFSGKRYNSVRDCWGLYRKHLQSSDSAAGGQIQAVWQAKATDLFSDLLHSISNALGFSFTKSYIVENSYLPDAHLYEEIDNLKMKQLLISGLENGIPVKINQ